ncbi:Lipopolysaccharide export system protein LptA [Andreprevotia sp. IGB-42]|uniref:lipopolysaccharide transport periplasmic protein LptA n=1 Tax=Andreprevotia sp. IGB-42 TaxID=2497473 RepID=UPI00135B990D|nr:lipopolysaccharide transport periplasmic protein LptA [Andreprevotia sp. IGB-42]KAF0814613.1 Lipopolysaccharide export system protein LptA [Andreprevotia sp. IGB-42]
MNRNVLKFVLLALLPLASMAHAEQGDRDKPMRIESDQGMVEQKKLTRTATGNVIVTQGTMTLRSARLISREDAQGNQSMTGNGSPVHFRQKLDSGEWIDAEALRFEYDGASGTLKLLDKAWVKRGKDEVFGDVITYNTNTEVYEALGNKEGSGRVNITFQPKPKNASQAASAPAGKAASAPAGKAEAK